MGGALTPPGGGPSKRTHLLRATLLLAVGVALLIALVSHVGFDEVKGVLAGSDRRLLGVALLLFLSQTFIVGVRWWLAVRLCGFEGRLVSLLRGAITSHVVNFIAPGHFGEPVASAWLGRSGRAPGVEAFALLVATKAVASLLNIVLLLACLVPLATEVDPEALPQTGLIAAVAFGLSAAAFTAILHPGIAAWGTRLLSRGSRALLAAFERGGEGEPRSARVARWVEVFCGRFRDSFVLLARRPLALGATTAVSMVKVALMMVTVWLIYAALGSPLSPAGATFVGTVDAAGNLAAVWVPGNLGVQEVVHSSASAGALGIERSAAVSASLLVKAMIVAQVLFGALLWLALAPLDRTR